jgi:hypothetical protein
MKKLILGLVVLLSFSFIACDFFTKSGMQKANVKLINNTDYELMYQISYNWSEESIKTIKANSVVEFETNEGYYDGYEIENNTANEILQVRVCTKDEYDYYKSLDDTSKIMDIWGVITSDEQFLEVAGDYKEERKRRSQDYTVTVNMIDDELIASITWKRK